MPIPWRLALTMTVLSGNVCFFASCRPWGEAERPTPLPRPTTEDPTDDIQPSVRPAIINSPELAIDDRSFSPASAADGWDSEAAAEAVDRQLSALAQWLADPQANDSRRLAKIVAEDYRGSKLRPLNPQPVFEDSVFVVHRGPDGDEAAMEYRGVDGFASAIREMFADAEKVRAKFKIDGIEVEGDSIRTNVVVQTSSSHRSSAVQQSAIWRCEWSTGKSPRLKMLISRQYEEVISRTPSKSRFSDCTDAVLGGNAEFRPQFASSLSEWMDTIDFQLLNDNGGYQGIAVGDINGDGLDDLYVCQPGGLPNRLFIQRNDGTAEDTSQAAGVDWHDASQGTLILDLDNDGDQDLVIAMPRGLIFMANNGRGIFRTAAALLTPHGPVYSLAAADFDADGDLDIYGCCYTPTASLVPGRLLARPVPFHDATNGGGNVLFRNDRNWRFRDVTIATGLDQDNHRYSYASSWEDYDNDGDVDLYVANDYGRNHLYQNDGAGNFVNVAAAAGVEDMSTGMSVSWADYNRDGLMDLYVGNMWSSAGNRVMYQPRFLRNTEASILKNVRRLARGNSLFTNQGGGKFKDSSVESGVTLGRWAWSSNFVDINNDGWQDLLVANGFITQQDSGDL